MYMTEFQCEGIIMVCLISKRWTQHAYIGHAHALINVINYMQANPVCVCNVIVLHA